jgi:hypothetical protein
MYFYCYVYVFLLLCMFCSLYSVFNVPTGTLRLPWMRFFRAFPSVVRQMPGYNSQRRATARILPKLIALFCVLFVGKCVLYYCHRVATKCILYYCHRVATKCVLYYCHRVSTQLQLTNISISIIFGHCAWRRDVLESRMLGLDCTFVSS